MDLAMIITWAVGSKHLLELLNLEDRARIDGVVSRFVRHAESLVSESL